MFGPRSFLYADSMFALSHITRKVKEGGNRRAVDFARAGGFQDMYRSGLQYHWIPFQMMTIAPGPPPFIS